MDAMVAAMQPFVSILIPVRNSALHLSACLRSIAALDYPHDRIEVVVADGASSDGSADVARSFGAIVVENPSGKIVDGRNLAFAASSGDIIAFCDADCVLTPEWLTNAVPYLAEETLGGIGGPILLPPSNALSLALHCFFQLGAALGGTAHSDRIEEVTSVDHIPTCNLICRRDVLQKIFPLEWPASYGSDLEMSRLILGTRHALLLVPDVRVFHHKRDSVRSFLRQVIFYGEGRMCLVRRAPAWLRPADLFAALALPALIATLIFTAVHPGVIQYLVVAVASVSFVYGMWTLMLTRNLPAALLAPFMMMVGTLGWSYGFLRSLMHAPSVRRPHSSPLPQAPSS